MPHYSTRRSARSEANSKKRYSKSSNVRKLLTCLFLPLWLAAVVTVHATVGENNKKAFFASTNFWPIKQDEGQQKVKRTFYVEPDENNEITGQISAIEDNDISTVDELEVTLLQYGEEEYKTTTKNGEFKFKNVETGVDGMTYTLVAKGSNGFLAYAIHVRPRPNDIGRLAPQLKHQRYVSLAKPHQDEATTSVVIPNQSKPAEDEFVPGGFEIEPSEEPARGNFGIENFEIEAAAIPPTFKELERILSSYVSDSAGYQTGIYSAKPKQKELEITGSFEYSIDENGNFTGSVVVPSEEEIPPKVSDLNVFLLKDDKRIRQSSVEENGDFKLRNVEEGIYGLVAAGEDGFAAVSIRLTEGEKEDREVGQNKLESSYVAIQDNEVNETSFTIALVTNPEDIRYVRNTVSDLNLQQLIANNGQNIGFPVQQGPIQFQGAPIGPAFGGPAFGGPAFGVPSPVFAGPPTVGLPPVSGFAPATGGGLPFGGRGVPLTSGSGRAALLGLIPGVVALGLSGDDEDLLPTSPNDL